MKKSSITIVCLLLIAIVVSVGFAACGRNNEPTDEITEEINRTHNDSQENTTVIPETNDNEPYYTLFSYELVIGDIVITVPEYNFYFNQLKYEIHEMNRIRTGSEPFDISAPLGGQMHFDGTQTWVDYIHNAVADILMQYAQARASGVQLNAQQLSILEDYESMLQEFADAEELTIDELVDDVLPGMTGELYLRFIERDMMMHEWRLDVIATISFTKDELEEFFYSNWADFAPQSNGVRDTTTTMVDIRHILAMFPEDAAEADKEETRRVAQEIFAEWLDGEATEDSFAALATERTDDPGSIHSGGLYTSVRQGQMVPEFNDWIFDPGRSFGDAGIVETSIGAHVMFFVEHSGMVWAELAEPAIVEWAFNDMLSRLSEMVAVERRTV